MTGPTPTPSQTIGPFFSFGLDWMGPEGAGRGDQLIRGRLLDGAGAPVPDGLIEVWHRPDGFGRSLTDGSGGFELRADKPAPGPASQAPHLEVSVFARGLLQRLVTRLYFPDEPAANAADPVLSRLPYDRRATLVAGQGEGCLLFDVHLQGPV